MNLHPIVSIFEGFSNRKEEVCKKLKGMMRLYAKEFSFSKRYHKLRALKNRLEVTHTQWPKVALECSNEEAGQLGEKSIGFHLDMLSDSKYYIFHYLRLQHGKYYFQMDYFILCASFALILEVKNMGGELRFDGDFNQMTQIKRSTKKRRKNPVLQARLQAKKLKCWLEEQNFPEIPIHYLFVNSNEDTEIISDGENELVNRNSCNSEGLIDKIEQIAKYYTTDILDTKELKKLKKLLLEKHTPENPDILQEFGISPKELIPGVQCPNCKAFSMKYKSTAWYCSKCAHKSKTAFIQAINDYLLLVKPSITNVECRELLNIPSRKVVHRLLNSMELAYSGTNKGRIYYQSSSDIKNGPAP
jgi:hypothetical protein